MLPLGDGHCLDQIRTQIRTTAHIDMIAAVTPRGSRSPTSSLVASDASNAAHAGPQHRARSMFSRLKCHTRAASSSLAIRAIRKAACAISWAFRVPLRPGSCIGFPCRPAISPRKRKRPCTANYGSVFRIGSSPVTNSQTGSTSKRKSIGQTYSRMCSRISKRQPQTSKLRHGQESRDLPDRHAILEQFSRNCFKTSVFRFR